MLKYQIVVSNYVEREIEQIVVRDMEDKPCCAEAAARKIKHLMVGGSPVGVSRLDEVMSEINTMGLESDAEIGEALLKKIRVFNYVPLNASSEYSKALLEEYHRRVKS
jgi:hypothetical protein